MTVGDKYKDKSLGVTYTVETWGDHSVSLKPTDSDRKIQISHKTLKRDFKKIG